MTDAPKVWVVAVAGRPTYRLQWRDPITQRLLSKATTVRQSGLARDHKAAEKLAGELEAQLASGSAALPSRFTWEDFRKRYEAEVLPGLAKSTEAKAKTVFDRLETEISPVRLRDLTEARLSHFAAMLRKSAVSETTILAYLAHLKAALNWAVRQKLLPALPAFPKVQRAKKSNRRPMKGRPVTTEEFERMLATVPKVVGEKGAAEWQRYLRGLWVSGLRLAESLDLWWDREDRLLPVFPRGGRPMLKVPAELEKGHADRLLPVAPEFALLLMDTPPEKRAGPVFPLPPRKGNHGRPLPRAVSAIVSEIGQKANVKVYVDPKDPDRVKYASAHDLRRAFGERWAARLMPTQLMELMRHESIDTTLRYYVGTDAQRTADAAWAAFDAVRGCEASAAPSGESTAH
jgi:integrase